MFQALEMQRAVMKEVTKEVEKALKQLERQWHPDKMKNLNNKMQLDNVLDGFVRGLVRGFEANAYKVGAMSQETVINSVADTHEPDKWEGRTLANDRGCQGLFGRRAHDMRNEDFHV